MSVDTRESWVDVLTEVSIGVITAIAVAFLFIAGFVVAGKSGVVPGGAIVLGAIIMVSVVCYLTDIFHL